MTTILLATHGVDIYRVARCALTCSPNIDAASLKKKGRTVPAQQALTNRGGAPGTFRRSTTKILRRPVIRALVVGHADEASFVADP